jgi:hypothetical protein
MGEINEQKKDKTDRSTKFGASKNNNSQEFFLPGMKDNNMGGNNRKNLR